MVYRPNNRVWSPTAMTVAPLSLFDAKAHLRVTDDAEDALIASICLAACRKVEQRTRRLLQVRSSILYLPGLPSGTEPIELPGGAVASITSMTSDGTAVTGITAYGDSPAVLIPSADWPSVTGDGYPVVITYQVGFASPPEDLLAAAKLLVGDMYAQRETMNEGRYMAGALSAEMLMADYRIMAI